MLTTLSPGETGVHRTFCRICEAHCGLLAEVEDGTIVRVTRDTEHPVSRGHLCIKGPGMLDVTYDPDRVLTPLRRVGGPGEFEAVSWDEALSDITERLSTIIEDFGPESLALYFGNPGAFSSLHPNYAIGFVHRCGGHKLFGPTSVDTGARNVASDWIYGSETLWPFPDLERCDFLLMLGANPAVSHMSLIAVPRAMEKLRAIARRGAVVVVDPRRTETARAFEHVPVRPNSDAWLLAGMLRTLVDEGLTETKHLAERVSGFDDLADALSHVTVQHAARLCAVPAEQVASLARRFAAARTAAVYGRCGTNRGSFSTLTNVLMDALNFATGRFGADGGSVFGYRVYRHQFAGLDALPAAALMRQPSRIGGLPLVLGSQPSGSLADEILTPGEGQVRALFVDSGNPVMSLPDPEKLEKALDSVDLCVGLDLYVTETTKWADFILPAPTFFERPDVIDAWSQEMPEPWLQYTDAVIEPRGESRHEYDVYDEILARMGKTDPLTAMRAPGEATLDDRTTPMEVIDGALRRGPLGDQFGENPDGLSIERLREEHPSGIKFADYVVAEDSWRRVSHPEHRPVLWNEAIAAECTRLVASSDPASRDELLLFGRRTIGSINSWNHNNDRTARRERPTLLVHPADAEERGLRDGQRVRVASKNGAIEVVAKVSSDVIRGSVNYPHGWGHDGGWGIANESTGANVNVLASSDPADWEQVSGMCLLDGIPVTVRSA